MLRNNYYTVQHENKVPTKDFSKNINVFGCFESLRQRSMVVVTIPTSKMCHGLSTLYKIKEKYFLEHF